MKESEGDDTELEELLCPREAAWSNRRVANRESKLLFRYILELMLHFIEQKLLLY